MAGSLGIFSCVAVSGGHINPAVTWAFYLTGDGKDFPLYKLIPYMLAQNVGAFLAGFAVYGSFIAAITRYEANNANWRSPKTAMIFGMYFPNPAQVEFESGDVSMMRALFIEAWGNYVYLSLFLFINYLFIFIFLII